MDRFFALIDSLSRASGWVASLLIVPLIFASVYEVFSRYLFNAPTIWAYEIGYMATGTYFFLGMAYALKERAHIRIDLFFSSLSIKNRNLIDFFGYSFLMLPAACWLTWRLGIYAWDAFLWGERSGESAWNPVIWPYRTIFFVGFVLLTLQGFAEWMRALATLLGISFDNEKDGVVD